MHIKHTSLLAALILVSSFDAYAININGAPIASTPRAKDDHISTVIGVFTTATGNVTGNDIYGSIATLEQSWVGQFGSITSFDTAGNYTYQLFASTDSASLPPGGVSYERFTYTYANSSGQTDTAQLIIDVNADPNLTGGSTAPIARDDTNTAIPNKIPTITGNVTNNDTNGDYVVLTSTPSTDYGLFILQSDGSYTYELYETSSIVVALTAGEIVNDEFNYQYFANSGESATAKLTVTIIGNPVDSNGDTIFDQPDDVPYDNVDVEFNNRSAQATPLNSGRNIKGHLYASSDKDWFFLSSAGDEIITLEVCPQGASCFGKKSWVLYVFDPDLLTPAMELRTFQFSRWVDETGTDKDLLGNTIISSNAGSSNHMYLAYRAGFFDGALIGIVDPCFDTLNTVDIGVPPGARNYLIAISSPLRGNGNSGTDDTKCGSGSVVLERPDLAASGLDAEGKAKTYTTTEQFITAFPNSDDQYAIKITGTGLNPLNTAEAIARSGSFNLTTGELTIPEVAIGEQRYQARLQETGRDSRSSDSGISFVMSAIEELTVEQVADAYHATYNPENQQVLIPRITDTNSGIGYSVILQYHTTNGTTDFWFDVVSIIEIK
ncbi:VCBS domain-containing protein [Methyloprofundus sp.]|uniref:VCBS domain-containing protein n=1 Tax=Methyloprofundus sp. TaxID=2020875 RepID=UPI003D1147F3